MEIVRLQQLKAELAALLKKRILPPSFSRAYPTRNRDHELLTGYTGEQCQVYIAARGFDAQGVEGWGEIFQWDRNFLFIIIFYYIFVVPVLPMEGLEVCAVPFE